MYSMYGLPPVVHLVCGEFCGLPPVVAVLPYFVMLFRLYYRLQGIFRKVIFSVVCVKNSVHRRGSAPLHAGIHPPGADTSQEQTSLQEQTHPQEHLPPAQCMLGDTGNKWAVHILLECILVDDQVAREVKPRKCSVVEMLNFHKVVSWSRVRDCDGSRQNITNKNALL